MLFIEGIDGLGHAQEGEANGFARDLSIPRVAARRLEELASRRPITKASIRAFAAALAVAPGIVVGRMQNEGWLPWSHLNDLKVCYEWAPVPR